MENSKAEILKPKQHFVVLDGLRGIAALGVVVFHFMEWVITDPAKNFIGHGFLAVDFFFCLSGFVIGYAYDDRIEKLGVIEFFKSRLIRLHPLVILGSILGLAGFLLDPFVNTIEAHSTAKIFLIFLCSIFLIPYGVMEERAFNLFSFNALSWSLFWEYVANIFYALLLIKVHKRLLVGLTLLAAAVLCFVSFKAGNLLGGWSRNNFWDGGARVAYSFLAGLLIYRFNWIIKNNLGFVGLTIMLVMAFVMPVTKINWLVEALVVIFYFPLIVSLGAGTISSNRVKGLCNFSGNISYPLYMSHYWAMWIFGHYLQTNKPGTGEVAFVIVTGTILLVCFAYVVMVAYDIPVRKYLSDKRKQKLYVRQSK